MVTTIWTHPETVTVDAGRWQWQHRHPIGGAGPFWPNIIRLEPTTFYEGKPSDLPNVSNVHHVFWVSGQNPIPYELHDWSIISLLGSETGDPSPLIMSEEQPNWSFVLPLTRWSETEAIAHWGGQIGAREIFPGRTESTIDLLMQELSHRRFSVGSETKGASANQALATLRAANQEAVERLRKLTNLKSDWDGYGGVPPTEEAVKATAVLLLEIHKLTQGLLESPFIAPLPEGGLELEWELDSGAELMLIIPPTRTDIRYLLDEPTSSGNINESEGVVSKDATLSELISRLAQLIQ